MRTFTCSVLVVVAAACGLAAVVTAQTEKNLPPLDAATATGWRDYAAATEQRIAGELKAPPKFLILDFGASAVADRKAVLAGGMPVAEMHTTDRKGRTLEVPDAWVHHWRGAVLVPNVRLNQVFERLKAEVPGIGKGDVVAATILAPEPRMRTFIKLQRSGIGYNFVYHTEHDVLFTLLTGVRGTSTSAATKIAELYKPGSPQQRELRAGEDNRLLQRWNSYWRYEEGPAGVIVECESITLSRSVIFGIGRGIAAKTARESMEKALVNLRGHFGTAGQKRPVSSPAR